MEDDEADTRKRRSAIAKKALREIAFRRFAQQDNMPAPVDRAIGLYVGSIGASQNESILRSLGITHVLSLCDVDPPHPTCFRYLTIRTLTDRPKSDIISILPQALAFMRSGVKTHQNADDGDTMQGGNAVDTLDTHVSQIASAVALVSQNGAGSAVVCNAFPAKDELTAPVCGGGGGVLVHCMQGKSRSVTVVAAFLMAEYGIGMIEALERIRLVRPGAGELF
jgi:hypothetical protein